MSVAVMGKSTREAFGLALAELGAEREDVVVVDGDVNNSTRTLHFRERFPDRFFNAGIAESNMVGLAAGLAASGKTPVLASFACFVMCNAFDQLRMCIAFPHLNVKVVGSHSGISIGQDGPSQMGIEDVALACALPGFTVVTPADEAAAAAATRAMLDRPGPVYLRCGRPNVPLVYPDGCDLTLGRAIRLRDGGDVTLVANGIMVSRALEAAETLQGQGVSARVLDLHTVKPLDEDALIAAATETGGIVVAEEHVHDGGLGSRVAAFLATRKPVPMRFVDLNDTYAESGPGEELMQKYGLTAEAIAAQALELVG